MATCGSRGSGPSTHYSRVRLYASNPHEDYVELALGHLVKSAHYVVHSCSYSVAFHPESWPLPLGSMCTCDKVVFSLMVHDLGIWEYQDHILQGPHMVQVTVC